MFMSKEGDGQCFEGAEEKRTRERGVGRRGWVRTSTNWRGSRMMVAQQKNNGRAKREKKRAYDKCPFVCVLIRAGSSESMRGNKEEKNSDAAVVLLRDVDVASGQR